MDGFCGKHTELLMQYWRGLQKNQSTPRRSDIDPLDIGAQLLPHVFLCAINHDPFAVRFRLQGTFINEVLGQNFKGMVVGPETFGSAAPEVLEVFRRVVDDKSPILSVQLIKSAMGTEHIIEALQVPLAGDTGRIDFVLGALDILDKADYNPKTFEAREWVIRDNSYPMHR